MSTAQTNSETEYRDSAVYWFVRLDNAHELQDHERAAEAIRELRRLGVDVRFKPVGESG
jgi:ferric-dicitrate binding protein FerR (iron transport regulator)